MAFTVQDFDDMLKILEARPEWRRKMVRVLFPEIDLPKALQDLAEAQNRTEVALQRLEDAIDRLVSGQQKQGNDIKDLKGKLHESSYRTKADAIFGRYLRNGRNGTNWIADQLYDAFKASQISEAELEQVLAADLLWSGEERNTKVHLILVLEASWLAEIHDVERAYARANILRRIGLNAMGVVGGREWAEKVMEQALLQGVVITTNGHIDSSSWTNAWDLVQQGLGIKE